MSTIASNRTGLILAINCSGTCRQQITEISSEILHNSELVFAESVHDLETSILNQSDIVILSVNQFEDVLTKLSDTALSPSLIVLYELDEQELAFSLTDQRIVDTIPVKGIHRLATTVARELERQKSQQQMKELSQSVERLQSIVNGQNDLICRYTPDFRLTFVNRAYSERYGMSPDEMIGKDLLSMIYESDQNRAIAHIHTLSKDKPFATSDHRTVLHDGSIRWDQWKDTAIFDDEGNIIEYQGVGREITQRKFAQDRLSLLHALIVATSMGENLEGTLTETIQLICETQNWEYGEIWMPDQKQQRLVLGESHYINPTDSARFQSFRQATKTPRVGTSIGIPGRAWLSQSPSWVDDVQKLSEAEFLRVEDAKEAGIRGIVTIPIMDKQEVLAVFAFMSLRHLKFDEDLLDLLNTALQQIAPFIHRHKITDQLIISEQKYRTLVDNFDGIITILDREGHYLFANDNAWKPFGLSSEEGIGKSVYDLFAPEIADLFLERVQEVIQTGQSRVYTEGMMVGSDYRWLRSTIAPLQDADGKISSAEIISLDITDEQQAKEALLKSEGRLRAIIDSQSHYVVRTDIEGRYTYWNQAYKEQFGRGDLVGENTLKYICDYHHERVRKTVEECISVPGKIVQVELDKINNSGETRTSLWEFVYLTNSNGETGEIQCVGIDITVRKQFELELQRIFDHIKILYTVDQSILRDDTLEQTASLAIDSIFDYMPIQQATILHLNDMKDQRHVLATKSRTAGATLTTDISLHMNDSLLEALNQQPYLIINDLDQYSIENADNLHAQGVRSILCIALVQEGRLIGTFDLHATSDTFFDGDHLQVPLEIATQLAIAIHTTELNEQIRSHNEQLEDRVARRTADLEHLKTRTEAILASSLDGIVLLDENLHIEQSNPAVSRLLTDGSVDLWNTAFIELIHLEDRHAFTDLIEQVRSGESMPRTEIEIRMIRQSGDVIYADVGVMRIPSSPVDAPQFVCSVHDISDRKQAEIALHEKIEAEITFQNSLKELHQITIELAKISDLDTFYESVIRLGLERLGFERLGFALYDHETGDGITMFGTDLQGNVTDERGIRYVPNEIAMQLASTESEERYILLENQTLFTASFPEDIIGWNALSVLRSGKRSLGWMSTDNAIHGQEPPAYMLELLALYSIAVGNLLSHKQEEMARATSEARYRALFEQSTDGVFILDLEGNHLQVNKHAATMFGYTQEEMVGFPFKKLVVESEHSKSIHALQKLLNGEKLPTYERLVRRRDGTIFPVEVNIELVNDENGQPLHIQSLMRDITERKATESTLRESEEKYRSLIETMHSGFAINDKNDYFTYVNNQMCEMLGYTADEILGKSPTEFADSMSKQHLLDQIEHRKNGERSNYEIVVIRKDGQSINLLVSATPMIDDQGVYLGSSAVVTDITPLKKAQALQLELSQRLQLATEAGGIGIWEWDIQNGDLIWDQQMYKLFGVDPKKTADALRNSWMDSVHPDDRQRLEDDSKQFVKNGKIFDSEFRTVLPDRTIRHIHSRAIIFRDENGRALRSIGINWDVTDERLSAEVLQRALEKERELGDLKSRFVSMASHEFRTPLATIAATAQTLLIMRHRLSEEKLDARLNKILAQVDHMSSIVKDVLQLSRIQSGRMEFNPQEGDLDAFCRDIIDVLELQTDTPGRIVYRCDTSPLPYTYDQRLMHHMINNLVSNALKYSASDQPVHVDLLTTGQTIVFKVQDRGIGIPEADINRLFEPFHRAGNVGSISGTGLGLSITKESIEMHGGQIQIDTELNKGTLFTVTLPKP